MHPSYHHYGCVGPAAHCHGQHSVCLWGCQLPEQQQQQRRCHQEVQDRCVWAEHLKLQRAAADRCVCGRVGVCRCGRAACGVSLWRSSCCHCWTLMSGSWSASGGRWQCCCTQRGSASRWGEGWQQQARPHFLSGAVTHRAVHQQRSRHRKLAAEGGGPGTVPLTSAGG